MSYEGSDLSEKGFKCELSERRYATMVYRVTKPDNQQWPSKIALLNFCDGGPNHFGGQVSFGLTVAKVDVYID